MSEQPPAQKNLGRMPLPETEEAAEDVYYDMIDAPEKYGLPEGLLTMPVNMQRLDACVTFIEKVHFLQQLAQERMNRTFRFELLQHSEGVRIGEVRPEVVLRAIERIKQHQQIIGEGGDAVVVIDGNELPGFQPEICYKFSKEPETPRGRNSLTEEAKIHDDYFRQSQELAVEYGIGVPSPYYVTEIGGDKLIAMEKLPAKSIDDILRSKGSLPDWFDIDVFCENLQKFLEEFHRRGLYHRDIHPGNIMIRQTPDPPEDGLVGYIIDFGLSGYGQAGMDPYEKWVADERFTYNDDCAIIEFMRAELWNHRQLTT
jgi:serine/threonine protein kinase